MIIQVYSDGEVKLFKGNKFICSFSVSPPIKKLVDSHLRLLKLRRREKWEDFFWGSQAKVRFVR